MDFHDGECSTVTFDIISNKRNVLYKMHTCDAFDEYVNEKYVQMKRDTFPARVTNNG